MADALTTITKLINSPPGQLAAGGVLAGIVWKLFERVEAVLTDQSKLEIAVWLLGVRTEKPAKVGQDVLMTAFDGLFGKKQMSWKCGTASICLAAILALSGVVAMEHYGWLKPSPIVQAALELLALLSIPVYGSVWAMREGVTRMVASRSAVRMVGNYLRACCVATVFAGWFVLFPPLNPFWNGPASGAASQTGAMLMAFIVFALWMYFGIPSILLLYLVSAGILRAARRFDIGFEWFNRKFDIEKKPLQCIGLVAGALVAVVYWAAVVVSRVVG